MSISVTSASSQLYQVLWYREQGIRQYNCDSGCYTALYGMGEEVIQGSCIGAYVPQDSYIYFTPFR
jgi:hypothetical protein